MISVEEAKSDLLKNTDRLKRTCLVEVKNSLDYFSADNIYSPFDLPQFNQSNVDGYAVKTNSENKWKVVSELKAGAGKKFKLKDNEAVRIFTGAAVPSESDFVIMQEMVERKGKIISIAENNFKEGEQIRLRGSQIKKGVLAIKSGTLITPGAAGFLSMLGFSKVKVYDKPSVTIIITGNELITPGRSIKYGKVYDSNSAILLSALQQMGLKPKSVYFVRDNKSKIKKQIFDSLSQTDLTLISGGVSVGSYDFVNEIMKELKVREIFYKVAQRPGKPLFFGRKNNSYIFGLPGNPSSVLTCFYEYVYPFLRKVQGFENYFLETKYLKLQKEIHKNFNLSNFLKAKINKDKIEPLDGQQSYILKSFAEADSLIYLPAEKKFTAKGEAVEVHVFPD